MTEKPLNSPGPLGHHYGPLHPRLYSPSIPDKNNAYTERLQPLEEGEKIEFPCNANIIIGDMSMNVLDVMLYNGGVTILNNDKQKYVQTASICVAKEAVPLLIETLQRALISFKQ